MNRRELEDMMRKDIGSNICYCRAGGGAGSIILLELDNKDTYWISGYWWLFYNRRIICTYEDDCTALIGKVPKNLMKMEGMKVSDVQITTQLFLCLTINNNYILVADGWNKEYVDADNEYYYSGWEYSVPSLNKSYEITKNGDFKDTCYE